MGAATSGRTVSFWTPDKIAELRSMAASGMLQREAATAFGVSKSSINHAAGRNGIVFSGYTKRRRQMHEQWWRNRNRPPARIDLPPITDVERYIAERGVTRCPPAYCAPSPQGARP